MSFWTSAEHGALSSLTQRSPEDREVKVRVVALDDEVPRVSGLTQVDVVKLDLEGGEAEALKGMRRTLAGAQLLIFEVNDPQLRAAGHEPRQVAEDFIDAGAFERVSIANDLTGDVVPWTAAALDAILAKDRFCNIICER